MADDDKNLKQLLIEAIRLTPEGIQDFLETPIPAAPTISTPGDVDSAIIASGVASKFICDLFAPYAGLTMVELLLRIGQHNSLFESSLLANLEYIAGADPNEGQISITDPKNGGIYAPGEMRFIVTALNQQPESITLQLNDALPVDMTHDYGPQWLFFAQLDVPSPFIATVEATYAEGITKTAIVAFTIHDPDEEPPPEPPPPPLPPEGDDEAAQKRAHGRLVGAFRGLADAAVKFNFNAYVRGLFGICKTYYSVWFSILRGVLRGNAQTALEELNTEAQSLFTYVEDAIHQKDPNALINFVGRIVSVFAQMSAL